MLNLGGTGHNIEQVPSQRLSGIQIDNSLTWNEQITKVKKIVLLKLSLLRKINKTSCHKPPGLLFSAITINPMTVAQSGVKLARIT